MVVAIVQARFGSTRLPGKVLMNLCGKPVLYHVVNRVRKSSRIDRTIVATSTAVQDKKITECCCTEGIDFFAGDENDVLDRFYKCAEHYGLNESDILVRITADCPLMDWKVIDSVIELYENANFDYASNINPPTFPDGLDVEVFSMKALKIAWQNARLNSEREHVTPYIRNHSEIFAQDNLRNKYDYSTYRWTLDEQEDYKFIECIYNKLYPNNEFFDMNDVLSLVKENQQIVDINNGFSRNEGYEKSLISDFVLDK